MFTSIRSKLTFTHLSLVALVALVIGLFAYSRFTEQLRAGLEERLRHYSEDMGGQLEDLVEDRRIILEHISNSRDMDDYVRTHNNSALGDYFRTYSQHFHRMYFLEPDGRAVLRMDSGVIESISSNFLGKSAYVKALEQGGKVAVEVADNISPLEDILTLSVAMYEYQDGRLQGVVVGTVDWQDVANRIESYPKEPGVKGAIVNRAGKVLAHPDLTQVGIIPPDFLDDAEVLYEETEEPLYSGTGLFSGRRHLYACYELESLGWKVYSIFPYRLFKNLPTDFRDQIFLIFLAVCVAGGVLSMLVARGISMPLLQLSRQARRVSEGSETEPLRVPVEDEVGRLIRAFNNMTESLNRTTVSRDRVDIILESIRECLLVMNTKGHIVRVNSSTCRLLRYSEDELVDHPLIPLVLPDSAPLQQALMAVQAGEKERLEMESTFRRSDGTLVPVLLSYVPLRDHASGFAGAVCTAVDMTPIKRNEEERVKLQAQLYQSQKLETVGTLAGGVAHDFNNNLSVTAGYLELAMKRMESGDRVRDYLEKAHYAIERCRDIVRQLLTFSRSMPVERKMISLGDVVEKTLRLMRGTIPSDIVVDTETAGHGGVVEGDETQLHQVVMNLASNAVQAMGGSGGILLLRVDTLHVGISNFRRYGRLPEGPYVRLTVSDNGHGMDRAVMDRIFDPFFSTKELDKGTGLGLSVVHGIVRDMKGGIFVDSTPGIGSTFEVLLPPGDKVQPEEAVPVTEVPFGNEHILCVDDDEMVGEMLKDILEDMGYSVTTFQHPRRALESFQQQPDGFDIVILDENMPVMTGRELARNMVQISPDIPIVLYSGYLPSLTDDEMRESGVSRFVAKPLARVELGNVIRNLLDEPRGVQSE